MSQALLLSELTREAANDAAARGALLVWPVGATEQHGPHLPVGTDALHAEWVSRAAANLAWGSIDVVVAPTLAIGSSEHHVPFGGTMSLSTEGWFRTVMEGTESLLRSGFTRVFIVNGHGGNHELAQLVARDLGLRYPAHVAGGSWWAIAWDALIEAGAADAGRFPGHAGRFETSLVMALRPELVVEPLPHRDDPGPTTDRKRFGGDYRAEHHGSWQAIDGYSDSPDLADARMGRRWLEVGAAEVARVLVEFHRSS
jgi:creatinine amidohydrolase